MMKDDEERHQIAIESVSAKPLFAGVLAEIHGRCFAKGWRAPAFAGLLEQPNVCAFVAQNIADGEATPVGFILCRSAADEAEIITFCVLPPDRGKGVGRQLLITAADHLRQSGIGELHLEVGFENDAAIALYTDSGFERVGRRPNYYRLGEENVDAVLMRRRL